MRFPRKLRNLKADVPEAPCVVAKLVDEWRDGGDASVVGELECVFLVKVGDGLVVDAFAGAEEGWGQPTCGGKGSKLELATIAGVRLIWVLNEDDGPRKREHMSVYHAADLEREFFEIHCCVV